MMPAAVYACPQYACEHPALNVRVQGSSPFLDEQTGPRCLTSARTSCPLSSPNHDPLGLHCYLCRGLFFFIFFSIFSFAQRSPARASRLNANLDLIKSIIKHRRALHIDLKVLIAHYCD
jgi:hypothetical protein